MDTNSTEEGDCTCDFEYADLLSVLNIIATISVAFIGYRYTANQLRSQISGCLDAQYHQISFSLTNCGGPASIVAMALYFTGANGKIQKYADANGNLQSFYDISDEPVYKYLKDGIAHVLNYVDANGVATATMPMALAKGSITSIKGDGQQLLFRFPIEPLQLPMTDVQLHGIVSYLKTATLCLTVRETGAFGNYSYSVVKIPMNGSVEQLYRYHNWFERKLGMNWCGREAWNKIENDDLRVRLQNFIGRA
jgi:hypothetical protein